jgi:hypothetical protein
MHLVRPSQRAAEFAEQRDAIVRTVSVLLMLRGNAQPLRLPARMLRSAATGRRFLRNYIPLSLN